MKKRALLLNADYLPFAIISWKRAFVLSIINKEIPEEGAEIVENYNGLYVRSGGGLLFPVPAVSRLTRYVNKTGRKIPFSRKNIFIRDNLTCQYCGKKFDPKELTYDHVISRHEWRIRGLKGTPTRWENIVTSCKPCNHRKGNSILEKCGMSLIKKPIIPDGKKFVPGLWPYEKNLPEQWIPYLKSVYKDIFP